MKRLLASRRSVCLLRTSLPGWTYKNALCWFVETWVARHVYIFTVQLPSAAHRDDQSARTEEGQRLIPGQSGRIQRFTDTSSSRRTRRVFSCVCCAPVKDTCCLNLRLKAAQGEISTLNAPKRSSHQPQTYFRFQTISFPAHWLLYSTTSIWKL